MDLSYIVHSERCALLLDGDGVCRWVVPKVDATDVTVVAAKRCVGARFVATLDRETPGFMGHEPRIGTNLLFALVTDGRVALARFGPVTSFERLDAPSEAAFAARESAVCTLSSPDLDGVGEDAASGAEVEPGQSSPASNEDAPELDDVIAALARDVVADADGSVQEISAAEEPAAPARTIRADEVAPLPPEASGEIAVVTDSTRSIDSEAAEAESELDALMRKPPPPQPSTDAVDQSLDGIAALMLVKGDSEPGPDDSELHVITTAFTRSEQLAVLLSARDLVEIELDTDSSTDDSSRDVDGAPVPTEPEPKAASTRFRPSGIVMRRELGFDETAPATEASVLVEPSLATDDETRRFSRAAGDVPYEELFQSTRFDTPRRGMLPRR
ncbi:MAG: hypothetical protein J0I07_26685 [Myxococcales bacterium]|nr:hypothetical protein [Myxococcales bacterium]